jgi:hypothetical protein
VASYLSETDASSTGLSARETDGQPSGQWTYRAPCRAITATACARVRQCSLAKVS